MMKPKTAAERQKARRDRLKREGFKQCVTWVHSDDQERYGEFIDTLKKPMPEHAGIEHNE